MTAGIAPGFDLSDDALASNLESVTLEMDVTEATEGNYFHLVSGLVFEQHRCPVASKRLGYPAHDFIEQLFQIQYGVYFLCCFLKQEQFSNAPFEGLLGFCRGVHGSGTA